MKILGVIAEYDPFHRGHARHLRLAREAAAPDFTYVVLSGCFKQRGEPALLSPYERAACALDAGADAVFALPAVWTVRDAEHYALGAVSLLRDLGATHLAFGAETAELPALRALAEKLEKPDPSLREGLKARLAAGCGYPRALSLAVAERDPALAPLLEAPNNTLAVCYLRACLRLGTEMEPVVIPRGGGYHAETIRPEEPSASALRGALLRGNYGPAMAAVTEESARLLRRAFLEGRIPDARVLDALLIRTLRGMSREELRQLPDLSEGLEDRLAEAAGRVRTRAELLDAVSTRRYPRARISRICACALLGLTRARTEQAALPASAVLLGLRRDPAMTALWKERRALITSRFGDETDLRAWRIWAQLSGLPDGCFRSCRMATARARGEKD